LDLSPTGCGFGVELLGSPLRQRQHLISPTMGVGDGPLVFGLHHSPPSLRFRDHLLVAGAQLVGLLLGLGSGRGGGALTLCLYLLGLALGRPQHPHYALAHTLDGGGRRGEPLDLGAQTIDFPASRLEGAGQFRSLRGAGVAIGYRDLQISPQLLKLVINLHAIVSTADDVERGSHRKQITIVH
jgi:hypothetical protein